MPHIPFVEGAPGPRGPMLFRPEVVPPLAEMAEVLMHGPSTLTLAERELIGTYVSAQNDCLYCQSIHGAVAARYLGASEMQEKIVEQVKCDPWNAPISPKLKALLNIALHVQQGGKKVTTDDISQARLHGATDLEIHDTVLIAANFCMMNRYVDGLATWTPDDPNSTENEPPLWLNTDTWVQLPTNNRFFERIPYASYCVTREPAWHPRRDGLPA